VLISADRGNSFTPLRRPERAALSAVAQAPDGALLLFGESGAQRIEPPAAGTALAPAPAH
jgi:hypothetical protein